MVVHLVYAGVTMARPTEDGERLTFYPLTSGRWSDFEQLFGERGACGGCWCMWWKLARSEFVRNKGPSNRSAMARLVKVGPPPGILAYLDGVAAGWCAIAPRENFPVLERSRVLKRIDDLPVWSVTCLFVRKEHRRKGLSVALLKAAVRFAGEQGGRIVEGYPVIAKSGEMPAAFAWTGLASAFLKAGFHEAARGSPARPIMRCAVSSSRSGSARRAGKSVPGRAKSRKL
jgi:GNAT superfamily N-acetyltransferase